MPSGPHGARFLYASDRSLLVSFGEEIDPAVNQRVIKLTRILESDPLPGVTNLHPAYCSVLVVFDPFELDHTQLESMVADRLEHLAEMQTPPARVVEIPVCYGGEYGPDLEDVAALHDLAPEHVIELHTAPEYIVYFLGFTPGFAYLGGLAREIETPRLAAPRRKVPAGSVGIAGAQTGVYPYATPGGWRLIGRTPVPMFQPQRTGMSLLHMGDRVRFRPIQAKEYQETAARWL